MISWERFIVPDGQWHKDGDRMDKNDKLAYFLQLSGELSKYETDEIENGIIAYFIEQLGYSCDDDIFVELKEKAKKASGEIKSIYEKYSFPIHMEMLVEFFEYLIEQNDKSENGIVFTPKYIADYISRDVLGEMTEWNDKIRIMDPGCGCGIFLISAIEEIHRKFGIDIDRIIENHVFGIDIIEDNIRRCRYILQLYCLAKGICLPKLHTNLISADSLASDWNTFFSVSGFDYIVGNPPYVNTHDMNKATISFLKDKFATTQKGVFNIFYAFVEHGLKQLKDHGFLEFIVPNNFLTIQSAEKLRDLLQKGGKVSSLIDFTDHMVFRPVRTYSCIIKLTNSYQKELRYSLIEKTDDIQTALSDLSFHTLHTKQLDKNGWKLVDETTRKNIALIEGQKFPIKDFIRTGIATLRDGIYFVNSSNGTYFKFAGDIKYDIEAEIVRPIYKIPELKNCTTPREALQYIIFPYVKGENGYTLLEEHAFRKNFPNAYSYLLKMKPVLDERDKGKGNAAAWYAYGRTQGLNKYGKKLLFPTFANHPKFVYIDDEEALFCNGYAVFENEQIPLLALLKILNSKIMDYYVSSTSYSIEGGYYCYQKKYIERFSLPEFDEKELELIERSSQEEADRILIEKYQLSLL